MTVKSTKLLPTFVGITRWLIFKKEGLTVFEPFRIEGKWWIPESPRRKITGTLDFDEEESITLSLIDCLSKRALFSDTVEEQQIILGLSTNGDRITLVDCFEVGYRESSSGIPTSKYIATFVFKGQHFKTLDDIKTKKVMGRFSYLDTWLGFDGFRIEHPYSDEIDFEIKYKRPKSQLIGINDELSVIIESEVLGPSLRPFMTEVNVKQNAYIGLKVNSPTNIKSVLKQLGRSKDLVSFAAQKPSVFSKVLVFPEKTTYRGRLGRSSDLVELFFRQVHPRVSEKDLSFQFLLFPFKSTQFTKQGDQFLPTWFKLADNMGPVFDLYFSVLADPGMYLQQRFLILSQALESYSRLQGNNIVFTKKEHKERLDSIIGSASPEYQPWLKKRLENSNEPSFLKRLKAMADGIREPAELVVKDIPAFAKRIRDVRNILTHPGSKRREPAPDEILRLSSQMQHLLTLLIYRDLGNDINSLINLIRTKQVYGFFRVHGEV